MLDLVGSHKSASAEGWSLTTTGVIEIFFLPFAGIQPVPYTTIQQYIQCKKNSSLLLTICPLYMIISLFKLLH